MHRTGLVSVFMRHVQVQKKKTVEEVDRCTCIALSGPFFYAGRAPNSGVRAPCEGVRAKIHVTCPVSLSFFFSLSPSLLLSLVLSVTHTLYLSLSLSLFLSLSRSLMHACASDSESLWQCREEEDGGRRSHAPFHTMCQSEYITCMHREPHTLFKPLRK